MSSEQFLRSVEDLNETFNAVALGTTVHPLVHSFWSYAEILKAEGLRSAWDVPLNLRPFYGDWHTLLCLDDASGYVVYLDDDRRVLFRWPSSRDFLASLVNRDDEDVDPALLEGVEVHLDPDLLKR